MEPKEFIRELADRLERTANVKAVFGEPIGEGRDMIVPVARVGVRGGGGGGGGTEVNQDQLSGRGPSKGSGLGLGLNVTTAPIGFISWKSGEPAFEPIVDQNRAIAIAGVVAVVALVVVRSIIASQRKT